MAIDFTKKRFLVIDDMVQARDALRTIAQSAGAFMVEFGASYQDAIYRIRNNTPDIILCDYMLGEGRTGQQMLEELRRFDLLPDETIFMMVTGEQSYEQVVSAVELVPDDYIIKPFSPDKLLLRLERVAQKKAFFGKYYREKRKKEYAKALGILQAQMASDAAKPYRFEILRQQAEVLLKAGKPDDAEKTYRQILNNYDFPWARAGVARALHQQSKHNEARSEIDRVVAAAPQYFDAADLKANICMAQGEHDEAQKIVAEASKRTPRNYLRKRLLAEAATLNGDTATALATMADVIANDTMPGAISAADRLAQARSYVNANDNITAEKTLLALKESDVQNFDLDSQASYAALLSIASPGKGKTKFTGLRPALLDSTLQIATRLDIVRASLWLRDFDLADRHTRHVMADKDSKKIFNSVRSQYALHGREADFRDIQKQVALQRIHHDEPKTAAETPASA
jgi:DNA-binding response OmpR family regulator